MALTKVVVGSTENSEKALAWAEQAKGTVLSGYYVGKREVKGAEGKPAWIGDMKLSKRPDSKLVQFWMPVGLKTPLDSVSDGCFVKITFEGKRASKKVEGRRFYVFMVECDDEDRFDMSQLNRATANDSEPDSYEEDESVSATEEEFLPE